MWKFKPFTHKEPVGLEGRCIDVGNLKIVVQNAIAEGGFSCVYLARDVANGSKQYALKHMICNDEESMELVMKEINVMKSLKGHPNIVTLHAHTILDMGRRKEALLVMEFCEKSLHNVLKSKGAGYFEEKQVLLIFRDACNAVFAMHSQFPPIAHRDLKPENLLLAPDGFWKLCDFGSTTTNHKRFEKPEEMGIEEDNIRKHTTPAYRAPEMWDLFRRDVICEKVDIWALGCLLFRICYFKNAFDGESKLQILNGNYRIPELPKYSLSVVELIRDMLQASPEDRPDITQVWFRINELLPVNLQKSLPNAPPEVQSTGVHEGFSKTTNGSPPMPQRNPPPPPLSGANRSPPVPQRSPPPPPSSGVGGGGGQLGAFWSTLHAKESAVEEENGPKFDEEPSHGTLKQDRIQPENHTVTQRTAVTKEQNVQTRVSKSNFQSKLHGHSGGTSKAFEISFSQNEREHSTERTKASKTESNSLFQDDAFNSFVADFDSSKLNSTVNNKSEKEEALEAEIERLKEQLKQVNTQNAEITSKFEKLSAICRSQRQEIQELKQAVAARKSPDRYQEEKSAWGIPSPEPKQWQAFADDPKPQHQPLSKGNSPQSVRTRTLQQKKQDTQSSSDFNSWGFGTDNFLAVPVASSQISRPVSEGSNSHYLNRQKVAESQPTNQPAGWAGF